MANALVGVFAILLYIGIIRRYDKSSLYRSELLICKKDHSFSFNQRSICFVSGVI